MFRVSLAVLALVAVLAPALAWADGTAPSKTSSSGTKVETPTRGVPSLPIEVSPFMKPQLGLAIPRLS
ncbi:MAG: hypothetical protein U1F33_14505 [Alphaproteobacteria bacterium]